MVVRGQLNFQYMQQEIPFKGNELELSAIKSMRAAIEKTERDDRYGSLLQFQFHNVEKFGAEAWGRARRSWQGEGACGASQCVGQDVTTSGGNSIATSSVDAKPGHDDPILTFDDEPFTRYTTNLYGNEENKTKRTHVLTQQIWHMSRH